MPSNHKDTVSADNYMIQAAAVLDQINLNTLLPWDLASSPQNTPAYLGLTSQLASGGHIIMWDFDNKHTNEVTKAVMDYWKKDERPTCYLVQTSADVMHFHVYAFIERELSAGHKQADAKHNAHSKTTGFRTLRITPKAGFAPKIVGIIKGAEGVAEIPLSQLTQFAIYGVNAEGMYAATLGRFVLSTYDLMQGVKFLQQLETAQKTHEIPSQPQVEVPNV